MTSDNAANAKVKCPESTPLNEDAYLECSQELLPANHAEFANNREQIRTLVNIIGKIKYLTDSSVERAQAAAHDASELHTQLKLLGSIHMGHVSDNWSTMQKGFSAISR